MPGIIPIRRVLLRPPAAPSGPTTVYGDRSFNATDSNWGNSTLVHRIAAADLGAATGNTLRITTEFAAWDAAGTMVGSVGQKAAAGDAFDFANTNTPAQLLWGASATLESDGVTLVHVSDYVTLPEAYDETKDYLIAVFLSNVNPAALRMNSSDALGGATYYLQGSNDSATVDKSGYALWENTRPFFVRKVEVQ